MPLSLLIGLILGLFAGVVVTGIGTHILRNRARRWGLLDVPGEVRKIHSQATPTAGGAAIALGVSAGAMVLYGAHEPLLAAHGWPFWAGALLLVGAGLWDDKYTLNPKSKFTLQIVAACLLLHAGFAVEVSEFLGGEGTAFSEAVYTLPLTGVWIVGIINAVNLIDGLDGLAAGVVGIAFLACATLFGLQGSTALMVFGIVVAGTLGTFLFYNFMPASIFMGDSGSLFLGYLLAAYTLQGPLHTDPGMALLIPVLLLGLPVLDTGTAIVRRIVSRRSIFAPDKCHVHHRLASRRSEKSAVLLLYAVAAWFGSAALLVGMLPVTWGYAIAGGTFLAGITWTWRLGCIDPDRSAAVTKVGEIPAPGVSVWSKKSKNGSRRVAHTDQNEVEDPDENTVR